MTTEAEQKQIDFHLHVPACEVRWGARAHLAAISMGQRQLLCRHFGCDDVYELEGPYHRAVKIARKGRRCA